MIDPLNLFFISTTIIEIILTFYYGRKSIELENQRKKLEMSSNHFFQCRQKRLERRHALLPKLLTFRSSDATMVFMTSVVITTHIANIYMTVNTPPN